MGHWNVTESFTVQKASYDRFAEIQNRIRYSKEDTVSISLNTQARFGYSFAHLFATLPHLACKYDKKLLLSCNLRTHKLFQNQSLINHNCCFNPGSDYSAELSKNVRTLTDLSDIMKMIGNIAVEAPVMMNAKLAGLFISMTGEMYNNAWEHSGGIVFGSTCFRNKNKTYCFSCYDMGIGITEKVKNHIHSITDDIPALQWALTPGNSTSKETSRGLGFTTLKSFAKANEGAIRICSGKVMYSFDAKKGELYHRLDNKFIGTLFEMDIIADKNRTYILK